MKDVLRDEVTSILQGGHSYLDVEKTLRAFPAQLAGRRVGSIPHTPWRLLEHMRIAQWDMLEYVRNPKHVSPDWPEEYWPKEDAPPDADAWHASVRTFCAELAAMLAIVADPATDLLAPVPHMKGATILREALYTAGHNAYHLGQMVAIRRGLEEG